MQQIKNKQILLNFLVRWFCYELTFITGLGIAIWIAKIINLMTNTHYTLAYYSTIDFLSASMSLALISWFAVKLRQQTTMTWWLAVYLIIAFLYASLVNFQMILTISIIFATTFIYEFYPFYLKRWQRFFAIKYSLDTTTLFLEGWFSLWKFVIPYSFIFFLVFYLVLELIHKTIYPTYSRLVTR